MDRRYERDLTVETLGNQVSALQAGIRILERKVLLLDEVMATFALPQNRHDIPPPLRKVVDGWRKHLDLPSIEWK